MVVGLIVMGSIMIIDQVKEVIQAESKVKIIKPLFSGPLPIPPLYHMFMGGRFEVGSMEVGSIEVGSIEVGLMVVRSIMVGLMVIS
jgi:hypothetical protein